MSTTPSVIQSGFLKSTSPGTPVPLATQATPCAKLILSADGNNNAAVVFGDKNIVAAAGATRRGAALESGGASVALEIDDLSKVYIDVQTSGDKVLFTWTS